MSTAEAAEYLKVSDRTVRRLITDGELTGYRIGRGNRVIRIDLDQIDEKLMRPVEGAVWRITPPKLTVPNATIPPALTVQPGKPPKVDPLDKHFYRFCKCGHPSRDHSPGRMLREPPSVGPWHAPTWENMPGQLSRDSGPCKCKEFDEDVCRRRRKSKKYQR